jgi:hypothetical protein
VRRVDGGTIEPVLGHGRPPYALAMTNLSGGAGAARRRSGWEGRAWSLVLRHGWVLVIPVVLVLEFVLSRNPATSAPLRLAVRWAAVPCVLLIGITCFGRMVRRDAVGFGSLIVPPFLISIASGVVGGTGGTVLGLLAIGWLSVFIWFPPAWQAWRVTVLRRRPCTQAELFRAALDACIRAWSAALNRDPNTSTQRATRHVVAADHAIEDARRLRPPDVPWRSLRDDYVSLMERWNRLPRDPALSAEFANLQSELQALHARRQALVASEG